MKDMLKTMTNAEIYRNSIKRHRDNYEEQAFDVARELISDLRRKVDTLERELNRAEDTKDSFGLLDMYEHKNISNRVNRGVQDLIFAQTAYESERAMLEGFDLCEEANEKEEREIREEERVFEKERERFARRHQLS